MEKWKVGSVGMVVLTLLGGCANTPVAVNATDPVANVATVGKDTATKMITAKAGDNVAMNSAIAKADIAYKSNQSDKATALLKEAASAYPQDKMPWLRMAQAQFDSGNYSEAIINAQEVLIREPKDQVAKSIVVVSGLRLATKALGDLRSQNEISGTLRTEAEDLAKILRENLGETALVAGQHKQTNRKKIDTHKEVKHAPAQPAKSAAVKGTDSGNPFGALK